MNRKLSMTVGIPVYNEEKTVLRLIDSIKHQKRDNFKLDRVLIISDGSTDKTVESVKTNHKDVEVMDYKTNMGKAFRVNQILKANKSNILLLVDSDITLKTRNVLVEIVKTFKASEKPEITCAYHRANSPRSLIGKIAYFGYKIWDDARNSLKDSGIRYYCEGGMLAFSKKFAQTLKLPQKHHVGDDTFSFYYAVSHGFKVVLSPKSKVYIDLPENLTDYQRQMKRFLTDPDMVTQRFKAETVKRFETMTPRIKLAALIRQIKKSPMVGMLYLLLQGVTKIQMLFYRQSTNWVPIKR